MRAFRCGFAPILAAPAQLADNTGLVGIALESNSGKLREPDVETPTKARGRRIKRSKGSKT